MKLRWLVKKWEVWVDGQGYKALKSEPELQYFDEKLQEWFPVPTEVEEL